MNYDLAFCLDLWLDDDADEEAQGHLELVISFAATIIRDICQRGGSQVNIVVAGKELRRWSAPSSYVLGQQILDYLAQAEGTSHPALSEALQELELSCRTDTTPIVISTRAAATIDTDPPLPEGDRLSASTATTRLTTRLTARQRHGVQEPHWINVHDETLQSYYGLDLEQEEPAP